MAVLKINALYLIKDDWNKIQRSDQFQQMKKAYPEAIGIIDQFTGPNFLENPVIIPYKITLKRQAETWISYRVGSWMEISRN